jgi:hypothetical protein
MTTTLSKRAALVLLLAAAAFGQDAPPAKLEEGKAADLPWTKREDGLSYSFEVAKRAVYRLSVSRPVKDDKRTCHVRILRGDSTLYEYKEGDESNDFIFFPVLDKGSYLLHAWADDDPPPKLRLEIERFEPRLGDEDRKAAQAAIEKASAFLLAGKPADQHAGNDTGIEGLVLAALCEGMTPERRAVLDRDWVGFFESQLAATPGTWKGKPVSAPVQKLYEHAMVTIGLADAASNGSAKAKALLPGCVEFLLASQLSPLRCAAWNPVAEGSPGLGGWRYDPDAGDADLSVSGWCLVALSAASAAGVEVDGTRDAIHAGVAFALRSTNEGHFSYQPQNGEPKNVQSAIGALACLMNGEEPPELEAALDDLDGHLSAYTQVDVSDGYPLYYAYYATRVHYLRGGYPWEAWRSTVVKQLLLRQTKEGTWPRFGDEKNLPDRYSAALGILILRLCLDEVPAYLKREVRGF